MSKQRGLADLFGDIPPLKADSSENEFSAIPIPGHTTHRLAKARGRQPLLLIATPDGETGPYPPGVSLENLRVDYAAKCRIWHPDGREETGLFTAIRCLSDEEMVRKYFLTVAASFVATLIPRPASTHVARSVDALVSLFRALGRESLRSVQGVWGELFLIDRSNNVECMLQAWHSAPAERYDFAEGSDRLEVKCAAGRERKHHFSLEQLTPPPGSALLIASLFTEASSGGLTLFDLVNGIREKVATKPALIFKLESVLASTLGRGLTTALQDGFDAELASSSLRFFWSQDIPRPGGIPAEVSDVRFIANLANSPTQVLPRTSALFRSIRAPIA